jgi:hypothetical protein
VTGTNGCTSTATAEVNADVDAPGATANGGTLTCNTTGIALSGTGNGSFAWSGPGGFSSNAQSPLVSTAGTYTLTVTGANGCTSTATAEVNADVDAPGATANGGTLTCNTTGIALSGTGNGSFAWSGPDGFSSNAQSPLVSTAGTYTLTVTGANGCTSTATAVVSQDTDLPLAVVSATFIGCAGEAATLSFTSADDIVTTTWSSPGGSVISDGATALADAPGTYTLLLTAANGCSNSYTADVVVDPNCGDDCPPVIISCPPDITVSCVDDFSPFGIGGEPVWRKKETCPEITSLGWNDEILSNCPFVIRRTFWAEDAAGSQGTCSHTITVIDEVAPIFMDVPADLVLSCEENIDDIALPAVWGYDECTKTQVNVEHEMTYLPGECPGTYTLLHTWTAVDQCGNVGQAHWTISVMDMEAPEFTCTLADLEIATLDELPEPEDCKAFDNCGGEVYVYFTEHAYVSEDCKGGLTVIRTWSTADECGNAASVQQTITVCDKKVPDQANATAKSKVTTEVAPNPFRLECAITLTPTVRGKALVEITDLQGRKVTELFTGMVEAGVPVRLTFDPQERDGAVYLYRVILDGEATQGRLMYQP